MSDVYAAYDPSLDRKVALKLLRADATAGQSRERLLREAKAIARLSHPNVVVVHEAGEVDGRLFIAMEFVDGLTVTEWLTQARRTRAEVLQVFTMAARGLAAAHDVGLIHRDFKPQNVMVAKSGAVRVMDFGLARLMGDEEPGDLSGPAASPSRKTTTPSVKLTQTGALLGTPAYMAPEQFEAGPTDARTDQFSFCVALYEALYGERPFRGETLVALTTAVTTGAIADPPAGTRVPTWLRRVLLRGLQTDPSRRFSSMSALLTALQTDPTVRTRRLALGLAVLLCVAGVALGARRLSGPREPMCLSGPARLAGLWEPAGLSSPRKAQIQRAFAATGKSYAAQAFVGAARFLDAYVAKWLGGYRDACEATHVRGDQSAEVLDLRMTCLQDRLNSVRALTNVFATADDSTVENAIAAASSLPALEPCAEVARLRAVIQPPRDEALRKRVDDLREQRARLAALRDSGRCVEASELATDLLKEVRSTGYRPLVAETLLAAGFMYNNCAATAQATAWLKEAYATAVEAHDDDSAAVAATYFSGILANGTNRTEEARTWLDIAQASIKRLGDRPLLHAWWLVSEGAILLEEGRSAEAIAVHQQAVSLKAKVLGKSHPDVVTSMLDVALGLQAAGRQEEALAYQISSVEEASSVLGPNHPMVGRFFNNKGEVLNLLGRHEEAEEAFERSLGIFRRAGTDPEIAAHPLTGLGTAELGRGRPEAAVAPLEEALKIRVERKVGHERLGETRFALARALWSRPAERPRALDLARAARADYAQVKTGAKALAAVDAWMKAPSAR
jgi:tetratricopeptide (TPR) repeat protein